MDSPVTPVVNTPTLNIREFQPTDWSWVWSILESVFRAGDTYCYATNISEAEAYQAWIEIPLDTFVAEHKTGEIVGSYFIKANHPGQGSHVCNCGYVVRPSSRGMGIGYLMGIHSQEKARNMGFRAMQFNMVVSTNEAAVVLWKKLGFHIVGILPGAFHHPILGEVDSYVMFKTLR